MGKQSWIKFADDLKSGDIVETVTKIPQHSPIWRGTKIPFIKHYGMVVSVNGKQHIVHNIIGRNPTIDPLDEVFKDRTVHRILRTGVTDQEIISKYNECKDQPYKLFSWNCEDLVSYLAGVSIGYPQRNGWLIGLTTFGVILLVIFLMVFKKRK